jgi:hypothetical protein
LFPPPLADLPQTFRTLCPTPSCHERAQSFFMRDGRLWDQYKFPFFVFGSGLKIPTTLPHPILFFS